MKILFIVFIFIALLNADIAIVMSKFFDVKYLDRVEISRIFLAKTNRVNSKRVKVVELKNNSYKKEFYKKISGKTLAQLRSYWTTLIFTGKAQPPKQIKNKEELLKKMQDDNSIITYLPLSEVTDEMRVLYTMEKVK